MAFVLGRSSRCAPMRPAVTRSSRTASLSDLVRESLGKGSAVPALAPEREASIKARLLPSLKSSERALERGVGTGVA